MRSFCLFILLALLSSFHYSSPCPENYTNADIGLSFQHSSEWQVNYYPEYKGVTVTWKDSTNQDLVMGVMIALGRMEWADQMEEQELMEFLIQKNRDIFETTEILKQERITIGNTMWLMSDTKVVIHGREGNIQYYISEIGGKKITMTFSSMIRHSKVEEAFECIRESAIFK